MVKRPLPKKKVARPRNRNRSHCQAFTSSRPPANQNRAKQKKRPLVSLFPYEVLVGTCTCLYCSSPLSKPRLRKKKKRYSTCIIRDLSQLPPLLRHESASPQQTPYHHGPSSPCFNLFPLPIVTDFRHILHSLTGCASF
jgi:hypothetical protein